MWKRHLNVPHDENCLLTKHIIHYIIHPSNERRREKTITKSYFCGIRLWKTSHEFIQLSNTKTRKEYFRSWILCFAQVVVDFFWTKTIMFLRFAYGNFHHKCSEFSINMFINRCQSVHSANKSDWIVFINIIGCVCAYAFMDFLEHCSWYLLLWFSCRCLRVVEWNL